MHTYKLHRSQDYPTSGGLLLTQSVRRMEEALVGYQVLRRNDNSELRILRKKMIVNVPMATEWYLTKTPFDEDRIRCMIRIYAGHREAAVLEDRIGIGSGHLRGTMVDGESRVGTMYATIMVAEEGGDDRSFDEICAACVMTYEGRCVYMYAVEVVSYPVIAGDRSSCLAEEVLPADIIGVSSRRHKRVELPITLNSLILMCCFHSYNARRSWQLRAAVNKPHRSIPHKTTATSAQPRTP